MVAGPCAGARLRPRCHLAAGLEVAGWRLAFWKKSGWNPFLLHGGRSGRLAEGRQDQPVVAETKPTPETTFKRFKVGTLVRVMDSLTEAGRITGSMFRQEMSP